MNKNILIPLLEYVIRQNMRQATLSVLAAPARRGGEPQRRRGPESLRGVQRREGAYQAIG